MRAAVVDEQAEGRLARAAGVERAEEGIFDGCDRRGMARGDGAAAVGDEAGALRVELG